MTNSTFETMRLIRRDFACRCDFEGRPANLSSLLSMLVSPGAFCVPRYRLQCFFRAHGLPPLAWLLRYLNIVLYGVRIDDEAQIAGGLHIAHAVRIQIVGRVMIGENCVLMHRNTVGEWPFLEPGRASGPVVVGNDVVFASGAAAYGPITIGDGCHVGPNTVVQTSFPAGSMLLGVPAQAIGVADRQPEAGPST